MYVDEKDVFKFNSWLKHCQVIKPYIQVVYSIYTNSLKLFGSLPDTDQLLVLCKGH